MSSEIKLIISKRAPLEGILELFQKVGEASNWQYPPQASLERIGGLENWLTQYECWRHLTLNLNGLCIASLQLQCLDEKLRRRPLSEKERAYYQRAYSSQKTFQDLGYSLQDLILIQKFAVHPNYRGEGKGGILLKAALNCIEAQNKLAAGVALKTSAARNLYLQKGASSMGLFIGHSRSTVESFLLLPSSN